MAGAFVEFVGHLVLLIYLVVDYRFAQALYAHKAVLAELDDCAPDESPDLDPIAVLNELAKSAVDVYQRQQETQHPQSYAAVDEAAATLEAARRPTRQPVQTAVVVCGMAAPLVVLLSLLLPSWMGWAHVGVPSLVAYLVVLPGIAAAAVFALRVHQIIHETVDVSRSDWLSFTWFRLDFMFVMSAVALLGVGAWLVAVCLASVAAYLAHRIITIEKAVGRAQHHTQLMRDDLHVDRVLIPGSEASRKAVGIDDRYRSLDVV